MSFLIGLCLGLGVLCTYLIVDKFGQPTGKTNNYNPNQVEVNRSLMPSERGTLYTFESNVSPSVETTTTTVVEVIEEKEQAPTVQEVLKTFGAKKMPMETPTSYEEVELDQSTLAFAEMLQNVVPYSEQEIVEDPQVPMYVYENMNAEEDYEQYSTQDYSYYSSDEEEADQSVEGVARLAELNGGLDYGQLINFDQFVKNSMEIVESSAGGNGQMNTDTQVVNEESRVYEQDSFISRVTNLNGINDMKDITVDEAQMKLEPVILTTDDWHDSTNVDSQFMRVARFYEDVIEDRLIDGTRGFRSWVVQVAGVDGNLIHVTDGTARIWLDVENFSNRNFEKNEIYLIEATDGEVMTLSVLSDREIALGNNSYSANNANYETETNEALKLA